MLKRSFRLRRRTLGDARAYHTPFFTALVAKNDQGVTRASFVASKRVDKRAVVRNRARRKVRSQFEKMFNKLQKGYDIVFLIKKEAYQGEKEELQEAMEKFLFDARLINDKT